MRYKSEINTTARITGIILSIIIINLPLALLIQPLESKIVDCYDKYGNKIIDAVCQTPEYKGLDNTTLMILETIFLITTITMSFIFFPYYKVRE